MIAPVIGRRARHGVASDVRCAAQPPALRALLALCAYAAIGCGAAVSPPPPAAQAPPGHPDAPPTLAALPELPSGVTDRMHQGILVARQTLDAPLPEPPGDRSFTSLQHWADTQVASWIAQRQSQMELTRARLLHEGAPSRRERVISHAVLALLHEDTARELADMPAPKELDSEREIAAMYHDLMRDQANTFATSALLELRQCANLAYRGPANLRGFAGYCHARFDRLRGEALARKASASNSTTISSR
jgi:hypothetical protein